MTTLALLIPSATLAESARRLAACSNATCPKTKNPFAHDKAAKAVQAMYANPTRPETFDNAKGSVKHSQAS